ncbi:MAG: hypothetical protein M0T70_16295 [Geobacteraceae bacterium]|nr:hypothetical protein [Geobacteraceae bacterium]
MLSLPWPITTAPPRLHDLVFGRIGVSGIVVSTSVTLYFSADPVLETSRHLSVAARQPATILPLLASIGYQTLANG